MKCSLRRTIIVLFSALAILTLGAGILALSGIRQSSTMAQARTALTDLQLEVKNLQLLRYQASAAESSLAVDSSTTAAFLALSQLTRSINTLGQEQTLNRVSVTADLANQLESFRDNYLALLSSYNETSKNQLINQELYALINQRLFLSPTPANEKSLSNLESLKIQTTSHPLKVATSQLEQAERLHKTITAEIPDPAINKALDTILNNYRQELSDSATTHHQQQTLDTIATDFLNQTAAAINTISSTIATKESWHNRLALLLIVSLITMIALIFSLIWTRLNLLQQNAALAMESIRTGRFDFQPQFGRDDQLNSHLELFKEAGDRLAQSQAMLAQQSQQWQTLFDTMNEWVLTCNTNGICTASNHQAKEMTGYDAARLVGQPLAAILEGDAGATLNSTIAEALANPAVFTLPTYNVQHVNGSLIPVILRGVPITDPAGLCHGHTLFLCDLSAKRHAEAQLTQATRATNFLNRVMELALLNIDLPEVMDRFVGLLVELSWIGAQPKAAFFLIDKKSNCLTMTAQRGIDRHVIHSCALLPLGTCLCGRTAQSGKVIFADCNDPRHELSYTGMAVHGHYCLPVHTVAGEIIGVTVLYLNPDHQRDSGIESILVNASTMIGSIIRRRQVEDELKAVNQDLERKIETRTAQLTATNQELDAFAYSVSHDLRAPLRAIDGFSQALHEDYGPGLPREAKEYLTRIRSGCSRMESLTNDLLNLSRLTRCDLRRTKVNISQLAEEISEEIRAESPHRMVEWRFAPNLDIMAEPTMIRAALFNLLANSWKYSAHTIHASIELGTHINDNNETIFFIRDNGVGFDMRYAEKLFKAFQRLHPADQFPGNGIGLATVQRIIHSHGGKIWAEATIGAGATFYFTVSPADNC